MPLAQVFDVNAQTEVVDNFPLILTCSVPIILAIIIFVYGLKVAHNEGSPKIKWLALIPLVIGAIWGFQYFLFVQDEAYQAMGMLKRQIYLHYGAFFIQFAGIVALIIWATIDKRLREREA